MNTYFQRKIRPLGPRRATMQRRHGAGPDPKGSCHSFTSCPSLPTVFLPACLPACRDCCATRTAVSATLHYNERPGKKHNSLLAVNTVRWTEPETAIVRSTDSIPVGCKRSPISAGGVAATNNRGRTSAREFATSGSTLHFNFLLSGRNQQPWMDTLPVCPWTLSQFLSCFTTEMGRPGKATVEAGFFCSFFRAFVCPFRVVPRPPSCRMF